MVDVDLNQYVPLAKQHLPGAIDDELALWVSLFIQAIARDQAELEAAQTADRRIGIYQRLRQSEAEST